MGKRTERIFAWQLSELLPEVLGKEVNISMKMGKVFHGTLLSFKADTAMVTFTDGRGRLKDLPLHEIDVILKDLNADH